MKKLSKTTKSNYITYAIIVLAFVVVQILEGAGLMSNSLRGQLVPICAYIIMAVSLNVVVGISGELSLGHAGFMSVGAFTGVVVTGCLQGTVDAGIVRFIVALVCGGALAGVVGFIVGVPVLRLRGDYLAIVTLAFGEIIKSIMNCVYAGVDSTGVHFSLKDSASLALGEGGKVLINGPMGATGVTKLSTFTSGIVLILITLIIVFHLINSRQGRAIMAIRDNRIAAESVGLNITRYKLTAFITSAVLAGMAGVLYSLNYSTVTAVKFNFNTSILVLVFVVLGGMGNIRGSIIAAALLTILPELLRAFSDYRMLIYAILLIVVMIFSHNPRMQYLRQRIFGVFRKKDGERI